jgi:hypothetical protein
MMELMMNRIGKKALKSLHIFEYLSPVRDPKEMMQELSDEIKEVAKQRHPELFPEEEKKAEDGPAAVEAEKPAVEGESKEQEKTPEEEKQQDVNTE